VDILKIGCLSVKGKCLTVKKIAGIMVHLRIFAVKLLITHYKTTVEMALRLIFIFCFAGIALKGFSQVSFKTEYFGTSSFWLDKGDEPREKIGDSKGSAVVYQGSINVPLSVKTNDNGQPTVWAVGLGGSYATLDNRDFTEDLVISDILNMELGLSYMRPINRKWSLMANVGVGIYSPYTDLSKIRATHILGSVSTVFICQVRSNLDLGFGVAINSTFGYPMAFPAMYLNWRLQGKFDFMLSMTNGLKISSGYDVNRFLKLSLIAEMNGQTALLEKEGKDMIFTHQYIVAGFQPEIKIGKRISIPVTAGISAVRPAYFSDRTLKAMFRSVDDYYFQVSPYLSAGVTISF